jgi:hypothetical protein
MLRRSQLPARATSIALGMLLLSRTFYFLHLFLLLTFLKIHLELIPYENLSWSLALTI